jgi:cytochrome c-type biogenesis protein CcmF
MIAEIGHFALVLAFALSLYPDGRAALRRASRSDTALMAHRGPPAAYSQFAFVAVAFAALTWLYVVSDFTVENVWANSHTAKPLIYKIAGVWGNHEGSMVLWVLILALFGAAVALFGSNLPLTLRSRVLGVQGSIGAAFLLFILPARTRSTASTRRPSRAAASIRSCRIPALAIHPPFLYAGYVGLSIAFSFAVAALIEGRVDAAWARWVRPWTLAAWMFLTVGIALGSWWAYYELGWGGFWFWDPVENASFMPWLVAIALLHTAIVVEKRNALKVWTILLAILAFSLSLLGAFLVRSGVLTSVHTFAVDPERGVFILAILCVFVGGSLGLFAWRAPTLKPGGLFAPISREGALVVNNLLLAAATASGVHRHALSPGL